MTGNATQSKAKISVIIVNYNAGDRLRRCLEALAGQTRQADEIIVIDNGSQDDSLKLAESENPRATIIRAGENLGFAVANNRAVAKTECDWIAFLNPDAYPFADWLAKIETAITRFPDCHAFGSLQIDANNPDLLDGAGDVFHASGAPYRGHFHWPLATAPDDGECFSPCAAAAVYRKSTFEKLGGFEESFFCYCEDVDLGYRLRLAGGHAIQLSGARVLHEGSGVTGRHSAFSIYHGHRNRIWTYVRNTPAPVLLVSLPYFLCMNLMSLAACAFAGQGGAYLRAMRDAAAGLAQQMTARQRIQAARKISAWEACAMLTWSPIALFRRRADIRAIHSSKPH